MKFRNTLMATTLMALVGGSLLGGCAVSPMYTEAEVVDEPVVVASYQPRYYDGRWVYYQEGGWGYWDGGYWYAYPLDAPIYVSHRYPHARNYRPAAYHRGYRGNHRGHAAASYRPHSNGRGAQARSDHRGDGGRGGNVHTTRPARRGDRVQGERRQQGQGQGASSDDNNRRRQGNQRGTAGARRGGGEKRGKSDAAGRGGKDSPRRR